MRERPRIAMVSANAYPVMGGVETHVYEVAPRLAAAGFDVTILTTDLTGTLPATDQIRGVPVRRVPARPAERDYYFAPDIYRTIRSEKWDLVHCQGYHTLVAPLAMAASTRSRIPYVVTFHSGGHDSAVRNLLRGPQHLVLRPLFARARRLICVSDWEASHFAHELRLAPSRFITIPNGAELVAPASADGQVAPGPGEPGTARESTLVLAIGRIEKYKGHQRVVAAMPELVGMDANVRLRIVGSGPWEAELRALVAASPVADRIEVRAVDASDRRQMADLISRASLVVLMSEYESQGIAVLEALGQGRRVVVADTSALGEYARAGAARAVPLDAPPNVLAQAMYDEMTGPARPRYELPTWDQCAASLEALYRHILGDGTAAQ